MNRYLVDTSVVSAYAPYRPPVPRAFSEWALANARVMFMPSMVVCEITIGIQKLRRSGATARADQLLVWADNLLATFSERILPLDVSTARAAGHLSEELTAMGRHPGLADVVIAATAKLHGFAVLTRNLRHFERLGIHVLDPFTSEFPPRI